jgi:hypothetical protein
VAGVNAISAIERRGLLHCLSSIREIPRCRNIGPQFVVEGHTKRSSSELQSSVDRWILQTSGKNKDECLSTLISSGGVVAIGFGSTRTVDLVLEFHCFRIQGMKNVVI